MRNLVPPKASRSSKSRLLIPAVAKHGSLTRRWRDSSIDRETGTCMREEAAMEPRVQSTLPSKFQLQVSADSKSQGPGRQPYELRRNNSKSQSPGRQPYELRRNNSKSQSPGRQPYELRRNDSKSQSPERQPYELRRTREATPFMSEEAASGNDIRRDYLVDLDSPQKYFVDRRMPSDVSIFRVPNFLKELKKKAYVPQAVSLGPYHSNRTELSSMDDHKKRAQRRMMTRFNITHGNNPHDREFYSSEIGKISQDEEEIWNNYEEKNVDRSCDLALDGCFLLEILRTLGGDELIWEGSNYYEPIFERKKIQFTGFDILNDILMLENQVPVTVLLKLLELEFNSVEKAKKYLFDVLVKTPGTKFYPFDYEDDMGKWSWPPPDEQGHHFLGLLYRLIVSPPFNDGDDRAIQIDNNGKKKSGKDVRWIPTAVELSNVGIKFQRCNGGIKKIYFDWNKATIYLPPINVTDHTEVLFRNLIALELCNASGDNYVTCYLTLMNNLIDTEDDVAVLRRSEIVKNYLGSDAEVAELFNGLCKGVSLPPEDVFGELQYDVMKHYRSNLKVWFAQFMKDYFSSPWKFLAFLGAILALVLTLVQTIYTIVPYYK